MALKAMTIEEMKGKISGMPPEERDQLLSDVIEQLRLAKEHQSLGPDQIEQIDATIVGLVDALKNKTLWDM